MHEFGLARDLVRRALREAEEFQSGRVEALHIAMGAEQNIDRESLSLGIGAASRGTPAEGATVLFTEGAVAGVVLESIEIVEAD